MGGDESVHGVTVPVPHCRSQDAKTLCVRRREWQHRYLGNPTPRYVGALKLVASGKGVSLHYAPDWLANGFALSEDSLPRLAQVQELSEVVAKIEAGEALTALETKIIDGGGSPLGGAKPKALIEIDGEQWVIKFFNHEYVDAPLIEHATMTEILVRSAALKGLPFAP